MSDFHSCLPADQNDKPRTNVQEDEDDEPKAIDYSENGRYLKFDEEVRAFSSIFSAASMWGMWVTHFILVGYVGYFFSCGVPI